MLVLMEVKSLAASLPTLMSAPPAADSLAEPRFTIRGDPQPGKVSSWGDPKE